MGVASSTCLPACLLYGVMWVVCCVRVTRVAAAGRHLRDCVEERDCEEDDEPQVAACDGQSAAAVQWGPASVRVSKRRGGVCESIVAVCRRA